MYKMYKHEGMLSIIGGRGEGGGHLDKISRELILSPVCMGKNDGNKVT